MTHTCPRCRKLADALTSIHDDEQPAPGDLALCVYCGYISQLDATLERQPLHVNALLLAVAEGSTDFRTVQQVITLSLQLVSEFSAQFQLHGAVSVFDGR